VAGDPTGLQGAGAGVVYGKVYFPIIVPWPFGPVFLGWLGDPPQCRGGMLWPILGPVDEGNDAGSLNQLKPGGVPQMLAD
jgi:hypothetical protein